MSARGIHRDRYVGSAFEAANEKRRTNTSVRALQRAQTAVQILLSATPSRQTEIYISVLRVRLTWPSASYRQLAQHAGLTRDAFARRFYRALGYAEKRA